MLNLPPWTDEYLVNSYLIDIQHQRLHSICGQLIDYCSGESHAELPLLLKEFEELARMHFETEEALLAKNHCPTLEHHRIEHAIFLTELVNLQDQQPFQIQLLISLLVACICEHLGGTDMHDKYFLQDQREWVAQRSQAIWRTDI